MECELELNMPLNNRSTELKATAFYRGFGFYSAENVGNGMFRNA